MDQILMKGLRVFAFHGVNEEEKRKGQPFVLDITLDAALAEAAAADDLEKTVNYSSVAKAALRVMTAEKYDLIEAAAQAVAETILKEFALVKRVEVTLKKPRAPIAGDFDYVAVRLVRERGASN